MKKIICYLLLSMSIFALDIFLPKAPPSLPFVKAKDNLKEIDLNFYNDFNTEIVPKLIKNQEGLYVIPVNNAAQLFNKGRDLKLIAVLSEGLISIVSDKNFKNIKDLNGEEIYVGGQGSSPDVISDYIFEKNQIKVKVNYRTSQEIAKLIMTGKINTAVLPEPLASMVLDKNKSLKRSFVLKDQWKLINGQNGIPQVGIFASQKVINSNKALIDKLSKEYKNSLTWIYSNKKEASKLGIEAFQLTLTESAFEESINHMNLVYLEGLKSKNSIETYLKALKTIDGEVLERIPGNDFYKK